MHEQGDKVSYIDCVKKIINHLIFLKSVLIIIDFKNESAYV